MLLHVLDVLGVPGAVEIVLEIAILPVQMRVLLFALPRRAAVVAGAAEDVAVLVIHHAAAPVTEAVQMPAVRDALAVVEADVPAVLVVLVTAIAAAGDAREAAAVAAQPAADVMADAQKAVTDAAASVMAVLVAAGTLVRVYVPGYVLVAAVGVQAVLVHAVRGVQVAAAADAPDAPGDAGVPVGAVVTVAVVMAVLLGVQGHVRAAAGPVPMGVREVVEIPAHRTVRRDARTVVQPPVHRPAMPPARTSASAARNNQTGNLETKHIIKKGLNNMEKKVIEIKVEKEMAETLEALFYDYRAKQDIINSVFDLHKYDDDALVVSSVPFKAYEKAFAEAKVKYDEAMDIIQDTYIPQELRDAGCRWEMDFSENKLIVTPM